MGDCILKCLPYVPFLERNSLFRVSQVCYCQINCGDVKYRFIGSACRFAFNDLFNFALSETSTMIRCFIDFGR